MAVYKVGQLQEIYTNNEIDNTQYLTPVGIEYALIESKYDFGQGESINENEVNNFSFYDLGLKADISHDEFYYLSFKIKRIDSPHYSSVNYDRLTFSVILQDTDKTKQQTIVEEFTVEPNNGISDTFFYELTFKPEQDFNYIIFVLSRGLEDYVNLSPGSTFTLSKVRFTNPKITLLQSNRAQAEIEFNQINSEGVFDIETEQNENEKYKGKIRIVGDAEYFGESLNESVARDSKTAGRRWLIGDDIAPNNSVTSSDLQNQSNLTDVCLRSVKQTLNSNREYIKVGIQTQPGTLVAINDEGIRVGRSGVYELNNGISIEKLGMIGSNGQIPPFLIDYAYYE